VQHFYVTFTIPYINSIISIDSFVVNSNFCEPPYIFVISYQFSNDLIKVPHIASSIALGIPQPYVAAKGFTFSFTDIVPFIISHFRLSWILVQRMNT